jgi:hypothetical protein
MRFDPDAIEPKLNWAERPGFVRAFGLAYLAFAFVSLRWSNYSGSTVAAVAVFLGGVAFGVCLWLFDRWWGERPSVRPIRARGGETLRRVPGAVLLVAGSLLVWFIYPGSPFGFLFASAAVGSDIVLIAPGYARRNAVRRSLRPTPSRPDATV